MKPTRVVLGCVLASISFLAGGARAEIITEFSAGITGRGLLGITAGPDGNLWFTERFGNRIGRITAAGDVTEFDAGISAGAGPAFITAGPDGNLWFTEYDGGRIGRMTPQGVVTEFSVGGFPTGITAGPDGNLWYAGGPRICFFGVCGPVGIGRITPQGVVTKFSIVNGGLGTYGITAGPDGNLWFTGVGLDRIGRITPAGVVTQFSAGITAGAQPLGITAGPDGNLWFTEYDGGRIGRMTPQGVVTEFSVGAQPLGITAGPDGNLWFTEGRGVGRITPLGVVSVFSTGLTTGPHDITAGPDGNLWFTETNAARIGRVSKGDFPSAARTFVGSNGLDANPCTPQDPCRQLSAALQKTAPGGEIVILDSAGFGPVVIDRAVSIVAPPGVYAGVAVPSGHGIDVNPGGGKVTLRGLTLTGLGGDVGINFMSGDAFYVENCVVSDFTNVGLQVIAPAAYARVHVRDSAFRGNFNGASFGTVPAGWLRVQVERSVFESNATAGIRFTGGTSNATIVDSVLAGGTWGLDVAPGGIGAPTNVDVRGTRIANNAASGLRAGAFVGSSAVLNLVSSQVSGNAVGLETLNGGTAYVTDTAITGNTTGIITHAAGSAVSLGDNRLTNNTTNGTFTATAPKQ